MTITYRCEERKRRRELFRALGGRPGVSERIIEICQQVVDQQSYKRAVVAAGQLQAIAELCEADSYWDEKASIGYQNEKDFLKGYNKPKFDSLGNKQVREIEF